MGRHSFQSRIIHKLAKVSIQIFTSTKELQTLNIPYFVITLIFSFENRMPILTTASISISIRAEFKSFFGPTSPLYYYHLKTSVLPQRPRINTYNQNKQMSAFSRPIWPHRGQFSFIIFLGLYVIYKMSGKKASKKQEERFMELQRQQEQQKKQAEMHQKEERLRELAKKSAPLVDYGLLDAYQFFLGQLAGAGLPQGNVYEFAAQSMLKYQKNKVKKQEKLREVERANEQAAKMVSQTNRSRSRPRVPREIKPQLLPFKGDLTPQEREMMGLK